MENRETRAPLRVVHVGFDLDPLRREPAALLDAWPTLPAVAIACARAGVRVDVVQPAHSEQMIEREGVVFHFIEEKQLAARVRSLSPAVVHVNGLNHPMNVRRLMGALDGSRMLVQDHGTIEPHGWRRMAWQFAYRAISGVAFTAREQARPYFEHGVFRKDLSVFEIVESSSAFTPGDQTAARELTGMHGDPCLIWTGRLDANKDPLTALEAFELATHECSNARMYCCFGESPLLEQVRRRIAESPRLRDRVELVGTLPHAEMEARFRAADFFVQTSHREGSGYSLIEALACGTTPLVTDIPSFRRIVGGVGSLTPVGEAVALAQQIVAWASRDRATLRLAARARFEAALTFDAIGRDLRAAYERIAAAK
jgi:glycosyltransferase involved in cell wall biosynthesis